MYRKKLFRSQHEVNTPPSAVALMVSLKMVVVCFTNLPILINHFPSGNVSPIFGYNISYTPQNNIETLWYGFIFFFTVHLHVIHNILYVAQSFT